MPLRLQVKLLRFLQEKTFERVGGADTIEINARIIAATNQNLEQFVREKRFREDLYYRLNVIEIRVPSLRDRPGEIVPLAEYFIERSADMHHRPALKLADEARGALSGYSWPGNIRELKNLIERAVVLSRGDTITLMDLPDKVLATSRREDSGADSGRVGASPHPVGAGAGGDAGGSGRHARHQRRDVMAQASQLRNGLKPCRR